MQQSDFNNQKFADPKVPAKATTYVATAASAVQAKAKPSAPTANFISPTSAASRPPASTS